MGGRIFIQEEINMYKLAFYDTKEYDRKFFDTYKEQFDIDISYFEGKLTEKTAFTANGFDGVCAFVNDTVNKSVIDTLVSMHVGAVILRCAGYNNVDLKYANGKIRIYRVPAYSPYAVAEYAMGLLLCINRKIHKSYIRTRDFNFSLNNLVGNDLHGKTVGVVGTGKIGEKFIDICKGFKMNVLAYDLYPNKNLDVVYVDFDTLCKSSDIISLHCPLTKENMHMISKKNIDIMKDGVYIINTSRGGLINSYDLLNGLQSGKIGAAALDVYEEESELFFEDRSAEISDDKTLSLLISMPNVIVSSHQAFLTNDALSNIAYVSCENFSKFMKNEKSENEILYKQADVFSK